MSLNLDLCFLRRFKSCIFGKTITELMYLSQVNRVYIMSYSCLNPNDANLDHLVIAIATEFLYHKLSFPLFKNVFSKFCPLILAFIKSILPAVNITVVFHREFFCSKEDFYLLIFNVIYLLKHGFMDILILSYPISSFICCSNYSNFPYWELSHWLLCPFNMLPPFLKHFLDFWCQKMLQDYFVFSPPQPWSQSLLQGASRVCFKKLVTL